MEKSLRLRPRLQAIADEVLPCDCVADIGTDHAYLPVWLCLENRCRTAIAADINQGPLDRAEKTVSRFGLTERISLRLGSGAEPIAPREADALVLAGMGGLLIGELLRATPDVFRSAKQILLQPMSSIPELREELYHMGYSIQKELLAPEEGKLYHILSVTCRREAEPFSSLDFILGRQLCRTRPKGFDTYLALEKERYTKKRNGLLAGKTPSEELLKETDAILQALEELTTP